MKKWMSWLATVVLLIVIGGGVVGAQDATPVGVGDRRGVLRDLVELVGDATGLEPREILAKLREGMTLADVISTNGGDVAAVSAEIQTLLTERIETAVADGRLTGERADALLSNLESFIERAMNGELREERGLTGRFERGVIGLAAEQTGLTPREILREIRSGKSLSDILTGNNVEVNSFIDAAVAQLTERTTTAVENGRLTQEEADALVQRFRENLTERLTQTPL